MADWAERFVGLADHVASWSKDRSTKIGAVIVGPHQEIRSIGYNGFPRSVDDNIEERHQRPEKYLWTEHAERNAIYNAARVGTPTHGCFMYTNWFPCIECARGIIQSGIRAVIVKEFNMDHEQFAFGKAYTMLTEAGVSVIKYDG